MEQWGCALKYWGAAVRGTPLSSSENLRVKGGDSVKTIIKLLEVITDLVRAVTDFIRELKR